MKQHHQKCTDPLGLIREIRQGFKDGEGRVRWDHNSKEDGRHLSKRIKIFGAFLIHGDDRFDIEEVSYDDCWDAVMEAILGR